MVISLAFSKVLEGFDKGKTCHLFCLHCSWNEFFLSTRNCSGIDPEFTSDVVNMYIQLFILLYADDTVIFGTDETKFWNNFLNAFYEYSNI